MTSFTQQLIQTLQDEIQERQTVIAQLKKSASSKSNSKQVAPAVKPARRKFKWSPERRRKFRATMAAKKKAAKAKPASS